MNEEKKMKESKRKREEGEGEGGGWWEMGGEGGNRTANEWLVRIQYQCLVPIYVFPEMKLRNRSATPSGSCAQPAARCSKWCVSNSDTSRAR
jgi:hypothetical protein